MNGRPTFQRKRDQRGDFWRRDDLDTRLTKIVEKSTAAIIEKAKNILRNEDGKKSKPTDNA
jgi:hypothetical protein